MKYLLGFGLLIASFNLHAINIHPKLSGSWYNPNQDGHGLAVEVLENNQTLIYWYVYKTDGSPIFLITVGSNSGNTTSGVTYSYSGMRFGEFNPTDNSREVWGTTTVTFNQCNAATLKYTGDDPPYGSGQIEMQRLTSIAGNVCTDTPVYGNYLATLKDATGSGVGVAMAFENNDLAYLISTDNFTGVALGQWKLDQGNQIEFNASTYSTAGDTDLVYGSGTFDDGLIKAQYTGAGQFIATPVASFQHSLKLTDMTGNFNLVNYDKTTVLGAAIVTNTGLIQITTNDGCMFEGNLSVPNNKFNQGYILGDITGCADNGALSGAILFNHNTKTISVLATNGFTGFAWQLLKK